MPWSVLLLASSLASGPTAGSVTPADAASGSLVSYVLSYGVVGVAAVVMAGLFWKGWRLISPAREAEMRQAVREEARADLLKDNERTSARADKAEGQRDEAMRFASDQLVPLLTSFTATTSALIPLLQELVRHQEGGPSDLRRRR